MLTALITGVFLHSAALVITAMLGLGWISPPQDSPLSQHIFMAFIASFMTLFVQTIVLFYIFAAGKRVRDLVAVGSWVEGENETHIILQARMKRLKVKLFPWIISHLFCLFITFWLGGATHSMAVDTSMVHLTFAVLTIVTMVGMIIKEIKWLPENEALLEESWILFAKYEKSESQPLEQLS
jgi:hypothetical protein